MSSPRPLARPSFSRKGLPRQTAVAQDPLLIPRTAAGESALALSSLAVHVGEGLADPIRARRAGLLGRLADRLVELPGDAHAQEGRLP